MAFKTKKDLSVLELISIDEFGDEYYRFNGEYFFSPAAAPRLMLKFEPTPLQVESIISLDRSLPRFLYEKNR